MTPAKARQEMVIMGIINAILIALCTYLVYIYWHF